MSRSYATFRKSAQSMLMACPRHHYALMLGADLCRVLLLRVQPNQHRLIVYFLCVSPLSSLTLLMALGSALLADASGSLALMPHPLHLHLHGHVRQDAIIHIAFLVRFNF